MFAAADTLITLLIFAAIALISHFFKRRQAGEDEGELGGENAPPPLLPPGERAPRPRPEPTRWEEELRRLLQGEEPAPPPPPRPPPLPAAARAATRLEEETPKGLAVELPKMAESATSIQRAQQLDRRVEEVLKSRGSLADSARAYQQAARLDAKVADHLRHVTEAPSGGAAIVARRPIFTPEAARARALLRERPAVRAAVVAAVVLGPPRGLEP